MFKKIILFSLLMSNILLANYLNIAVAANVSYAIDDLIKEFNKQYPNTKVRYTLGSSGKLTAQIMHGAPYDIFMSANMRYPNRLYKDKQTYTKPVVYAKGSLALFSVKDYDFSKGIELLRDKKFKSIAVANPKTAPYGIAAKEALENANIYNEIKDKFVYGESISQTVSFAVSAADIGIIAKSSLYSKHMTKYKKNTNWTDIDSKFYTPIDQGIVILNSKQKDEAKLFYDFILNNKAKIIFQEYGYISK